MTKNYRGDVLTGILENYEDEEIMTADGFDYAVIGIELPSMRLIYSVTKCLSILMQDMEEIDAIEHFNYNVSGGYVGELTPIWCWDN
jgi:hypothetical protein|tara:strand:+ start:1594 stop:1854 length:261 start_codon:yes stop_codon:yes gene_type:complete